jgi:hypothetical protein
MKLWRSVYRDLPPSNLANTIISSCENRKQVRGLVKVSHINMRNDSIASLTTSEKGGVTFSVSFSPSSKRWPHTCHQKQLITFETTNKYNNKQKPNKEHNHRQTYKNNIKGISPKTYVLYLWSRAGTAH